LWEGRHPILFFGFVFVELETLTNGNDVVPQMCYVRSGQMIEMTIHLWKRKTYENNLDS
jgi:hypothetical protein